MKRPIKTRTVAADRYPPLGWICEFLNSTRRQLFGYVINPTNYDAQMLPVDGDSTVLASWSRVGFAMGKIVDG